ncbi:helix-turn-helix domain-containing protein [Streptomyces sp. NPDC051907]|uniref:helix-turn-helix domain-containing protein n=1 Tax=Streptomyces sp. NPDC051907 TaxID=3155284 RepID=UPI0034163627
MTEGELQTLGLGEAEERAYEALLKERAVGADELARLLGLPRERLETALGHLVEHGLALPAPGGGLPHPAAPAAAIRTLIHRRQAELHLRSAELERLRMSADLLADRLASGAHGAAGDGIEVVTGPRTIAERAEYLLASAEREVAILDRTPYVRGRPGGGGPPPGLDIEALLDRGVQVRAVLDRDGLACPGAYPGRVHTLTGLVEQGLRARVAAAVPTRLISVDRRLTLLPPADAADPAATALVIGDPLLRDALVSLFETVWDRATPLGGSGSGGGSLASEERELLGLLAAGLKDEAIARRLGVHVHTARRRISRLLATLGARTRFQAGAQATLRGWLD